ncbi:MAG TPA: hypothetical protein VFR41_13770, partial [Acidimicrobiia bacterium]|nr:hypothetical protein [Acidimicrobiia bacterium]
MTDDAVDFDKLLENLRHRIDQRRAAGEYPPGMEAQLDRHFASLATGPLGSTAYLLDELDAIRLELAHFEYSRARISTDSEMPGGQLIHRAVGKAVSRQIQGLIEQTQNHARVVARAVTLVNQTLGVLADADETAVLQQLADLQTLLAEQHRELHAITLRIDDLAARVAGAPSSTWYSDDAFTSDFRGSPEQIRERYRDLAQQFIGCDPVLDIGFGRGE